MCYTNRPNGGKLILANTIKQNYRAITPPLLEVKSAFISICADIDRYIRLSTGCVIREKMDEGAVDKLKGLFPCLSELTVDQWNRLILIFLAIRNDNAHLYQNKPIFIDQDILTYLYALAEPEMAVVKYERELTVYGAYYVLTFLSQRYQLWTFSSLLLRGQNFCDMGKKEFHAFQVASQHHLQESSGIGKPIGDNGSPCGLSLTFLNDTLRRELTSVFLGLEAVAVERGYAGTNSPSFRDMLNDIPEIKENTMLATRLAELRNTWFHGHWLGDWVLLPNGVKKMFDFYETIETLKMLRIVFAHRERYKPVIRQIESFGKALLDYKALRLVEVSYKVLDSRLLTQAKFDERIENLEKAYYALSSADSTFYEAAASLLGRDPLMWKVSAGKFSNADRLPRKTIVDELKIVILHSESGFDIGEFHTDKKTLILCDIDLPSEYSNPINGKLLKDYKLALSKNLCDRIKIYVAK